MFADNLDKSKEETGASESKTGPSDAKRPWDPPPAAVLLDDQVNWEYKWSREDEKVHGPHRQVSTCTSRIVLQILMNPDPNTLSFGRKDFEAKGHRKSCGGSLQSFPC